MDPYPRLIDGPSNFVMRAGTLTELNNSCGSIPWHGQQLRRMNMTQSSEIPLNFAMFDFVKPHTITQTSDDGPDDFRIRFNGDKTALSTASTRTTVLPGNGQMNWADS